MYMLACQYNRVTDQSGLVTSTFDLLTLKVVSESRVTWATSVPILVFLGFYVLDLGPMYATDRQTDRQTDRETETSDVRRQTASSPNAIINRSVSLRLA